MEQENYERLALVWVILGVGSVLYYEHTLPDTLLRTIVIGVGVIAAIGATIQYFYHHWSAEKGSKKNTPP